MGVKLFQVGAARIAPLMLVFVLFSYPLEGAGAFFEEPMKRSATRAPPETAPKPLGTPPVQQQLSVALTNGLPMAPAQRHAQAPAVRSNAVPMWKRILTKLRNPIPRGLRGLQAQSLLLASLLSLSSWAVLPWNISPQEVGYFVALCFVAQSLLLVSLLSVSSWAMLPWNISPRGVGYLVALCFVALLQGGLAVFQYRNNPSGELMIPPGFTVGVELPPQNATIATTMDDFDLSSSSSSSAAARLRSGGQTTRVANVTASMQAATGQPWTEALSTLEGNQGLETTMLQRVNKFLWVLAPWIGSRVSVILQRNSHLLHIGSILTLTSMFDFPQRLWLKRKQKQSKLLTQEKSTTPLSFAQGDSEHILVMGDSLAVGLGSVDQYDNNKTNDWPFQRIENLPHDGEMRNGDKPGPAFPRALAQALAKKLQKQVTWRSAGVDGGDVPNIKKFCGGIVDEEIQQRRVPDVVVILCGANDMKYAVSNPLQKEYWPRGFRSKLASLIQDIRAKAPQATVIVPALPIQMFHKNSPLNVFPLGHLVDILCGFWDSQKKFVVDGFASDGVQYIGLSPMEINRWYRPTFDATEDDEYDNSQQGTPSEDQNVEGITLLSMDGVHPNARCYTNWGATVGKKLVANLGPQKPREIRRVKG